MNGGNAGRWALVLQFASLPDFATLQLQRDTAAILDTIIPGFCCRFALIFAFIFTDYFVAWPRSSFLELLAVPAAQHVGY
jgi:hypothetical protein